MELKEILQFKLGSLSVGNIISALITLVICLILARVLIRCIDRLIDRADKLDKTLASFLRVAIKFVIYFIVVMIVADSLGISITSLVALFGVAGLAVSLAAESSLSNLVGGVMLLIFKPFKVGDYVDTAGESGTVTEVGLMYTRLRTLDNKDVLVPNKDVSSTVVRNYDGYPTRRVDLFFETSYDDDENMVKAAIYEVLEAIPQTLKYPEPFVKINSYKSSSIEYAVRVWAKSSDYWLVHFDVLEGVRAAFKKYDIHMTYDHVNVHIVENDAQ
ncbi:MAG: mechanosensitive ion channel [Oscillospiraceae bacterium]|nr:mechanosensitive ion channel [Oscillospiraceae bacterium]